MVGVVSLVTAGLVSTYLYGSKSGYDKGYQAAQADVKKIQEEVAKKAIAQAAKAANPFQTVNPLEEIDSNPFAKAKRVLNPFQ